MRNGTCPDPARRRRRRAPASTLRGCRAGPNQAVMRLADGRIVPDLPLDEAKVARCRALAGRVTAQVLQLVRSHTTVSIERCVLRLLGFHGAGPRGVPWVNLMVDELHARGLAGRGAAWWLGYVMRAGVHDPAAIVERFAALPRTPAPLSPGGGGAPPARPRRAARAAGGGGGGAGSGGGGRDVGAGPPAVRDRRHRQHLRRRRAGGGRGAGRRRRHRRHPLHRAVAARLRAARRHHRGLRRHLRHPGELPHHARGARRRVAPARTLPAPHQLLVRPVHDRDRLRGSLGAARHAPQRRDVRHPLPRHQHEPHLRRPVLLAPHLRARGHHHQHRRGQLPHHRRRRREGAHRHRLAVHQRGLRQARRARRGADGPRPRLRDRSARSRTASSSSSRRRSWCASSSPTRPSSTCRPPSTSRATSSSATPTT